MLNQPHGPRPHGQGLPPSFDHLSRLIEGTDGAMTSTEVLAPTPPRKTTWRWLLISLISCGLTTGAAFWAFVWLINLPPVANCEDTATLTSDRAELYCAQLAAEAGELEDVLASLALVSAWGRDHPLYYEVQPLVEHWSRAALQGADQALRDGDLATAQALLAQIPTHSPLYNQAQTTLDRWQAEWQTGEGIMATAQTALANRDWATVSQQIEALTALGNPHWRRDQVQALGRQLQQERQAQTLLDQAVAMAAPGGYDRLGTALKIASQIEPSTYAAGHAQPYLNRWSDLLLGVALEQWYAGDVATALRLGEQVAQNPQRAKVAQELVWLSKSRQMAQQSLGTWRGAPDQLIKLYQAMLLANQIPADSPYHAQAQSSVTTWQGYLGDVAQLQLAQAIGRIRHLDTFKLAIDQAQKVPQGHPRRIEAQTMVAHWRQEIERIEDRHYLVTAHGHLAQGETLDTLKAAVQSASGVALHRALRGEAQSWIYIWTQQIQGIEDRPILNQAQALASRGELNQAIVTAAAVQPGRALHGEAQAAMAGWRRELWRQEQARQQALRQAAQPLAPAPAPTPEAPASEAEAELAPDPAGATPPRPPAMPSPPQATPRPNPLPQRLNTVPGDLPSTVDQAPTPAPPPPAAPAPLAPTPIAPPPPLPNPVIPTPPPLEVAPPTPPEAQAPDGNELQSSGRPRSPQVSARPHPDYRPTLRRVTPGVT
jgi:hypothetical protein